MGLWRALVLASWLIIDGQVGRSEPATARLFKEVAFPCILHGPEDKFGNLYDMLECVHRVERAFH